LDEGRSLLLDVWREVGQHSEIDLSTRRIAGLLGRHVPIERLVVWQVDPARRAVDVAAASPSEASDAPELRRVPSAPRQVDRLLAWCRRGRPTRVPAGEQPPGEVSAVLPVSSAGDVLLGPLASGEQVVGVLVLAARPAQALPPGAEPLFADLLEPLAVALENDRRLREITALREAAEADKRSLLTRLGRQALVDEIVGVESGLRRVMERVELVSRSDVPVLILGETGSGKELVARAIHTRSARAAGPFLRVNCGAIPPELIDSELFGHEKGSFTGAIGTRRGWFERADGGTLFLDEIGELPPAAQVRLLGVIQDGCLARVGGEAQIRVDVRLVAATHRDLTVMVREARFREDLWYRIAIFTILLPPLRDRSEDIPALANHFARRAATRFGFPLRLPTPADVGLLTPYPWPGNIRELAAVIDRAAILGDGRRLEVAAALGVAPAEPPPVREVGGGSGGHGIRAPLESLDSAMRRHVEAALTATRGRIEGPHGAAALLAINPHTLRARMRKLGIQWREFRERTGPEEGRT
jgi:transcriptional regulator with GAF, ATPase, and Fis domain